MDTHEALRASEKNRRKIIRALDAPDAPDLGSEFVMALQIAVALFLAGLPDMPRTTRIAANVRKILNIHSRNNIIRHIYSPNFLAHF